MLDFRNLSLEGIERLCQADMTWDVELVPLYYCPGKEGKACIVFVCSQLAILMVSSTNTYSHQWQQDDCAVCKG